MTPSTALQLYSIREDLGKDYEGNIRKVAAMGFAGVEPAGMYGKGPKEAVKLFKDLGMTVPSGHFGLPLGEKQNEILDTAAILGVKWIVTGFGPKDFETEDKLKEVCRKFNEATAVAAKAGFKLAMHNHWWEFEKLGNRYVYQIMLDHLVPEFLFEVDVYWVQTAGRDPAAIVKELGKRAPLLHIKDGPCVKEQPMTAVGDGKVDFKKIAKAGQKTAEWMVVELDACATDMMTAVAKSHDYLIREKLARGRK